MAAQNRNAGFVLLHRSIRDHWLWDDPIKLKWWLDLIMECNHEDKKVAIGFQLIECKRGQSVNSMLTWAERWKVNRDAASCFIKMLRRDGMIKTENLKITTRLTVCNYDSYNNLKHASQHGASIKSASKQQSDNTVAAQTKNELKNELKNEEEVLVPQPGPDLKKEYQELERSLVGKDVKEVWTLVTGFIKDKSPEFIEPYAEAWNLFATTYKLSRLKDINDSRRRKFATRIREPAFDFLKILEAIKVSPHLKGDNNRGWKTDFNWILENDSNYLKILEGNYN